MKRLFLLILFCACVSLTYGQINFKKFKDQVKKAVEEEVDTEELLQKEKERQLEKMRQEQLIKDTSIYNYIFSQGNRSSFFANRESKESLLAAMAKKQESSEEAIELEVYEKVFDFNRQAEYSIYIHPEAAIKNFRKALKTMMDKPPSFDEAFVIKDLVRKDTMQREEQYALGKTVANVSILLHAEGRYKLSEAYVEETINYFKEAIGENSIAMASLYCNHATISQSQGRYTEAEEYFQKAEKVIKKNKRGGSLSHAIILNNKALLYNEIGQHSKALNTINKAMEFANGALREKGRDNVGFRINKGLIHFSAGNYGKAEDIFGDIIELKEKRFAKNQTDVGNVKNYLASTLMEMGKTGQVPSLLNHSLEIFKNKYSTSHPAYIKTRHNLGRYHLVAGNLERANEILNKVGQSYLATFNEFHPDYLSCVEDMAVVSWRLGELAKADEQFSLVLSRNLELVEKYFGAMSEYEKSQYWAKVRPSILKFFAYAIERGTEDPSLLTDMYNLQLKTKGILLSASSKVREQILSSNDAALKDTYQKWVDAKENLLLYYSYSKEQINNLGIDIQAEEETANQLEKALTRMSAAFANANRLPSHTLADVKEALEADGAAVEIIGYPVFERSFTSKKNYAFLVAKKGADHPDMVVIANGEELDGKYAKAYLNFVKAKATDRITYGKFWEPVEPLLQEASDVHLSLDGIYFQVNIGALNRPDGTFVSDHFDLHLHTSTRDLVKAKQDGFSSRKASIVGFPNFGSKGLLAPLPGTKVEIEAIRKIMQAKGFTASAFVQKQATEANFKKITSPSVLHVATHGFFLPESEASEGSVFGIEVSQAKDNPLLRSGLMLANAEQAMGDKSQNTEVNTTNNGVLTAYEVMTLNLKNTDLVVLSACETGLGEIKSGEGVYGLQRAFQVAGAESVIMSLWKVSDEATKELMTSFYAEWMGGKPKEQAFADAQKQLRSKFPQPYFWGAFVMLN